MVDDFVAEILRIADAGGLLHLLQLRVQRRFVEGHAGGRIHVNLLLDPEVGECHVAVEKLLSVIGIRLEVGGLDLLGEFVQIARYQELLKM